MKFEVGFLTILTTATAHAPICAIRVPATEVCFLREFGITVDSATSASMGIVQATTVSVTPTGNIAGNNTVRGAPVSGTLIVTGWGTAPVVGATPLYIAQAAITGTKGAGYIWTWPIDRPYQVGSGAAIAELVLCNLAASTIPAFRCRAVFES